MEAGERPSAAGVSAVAGGVAIASAALEELGDCNPHHPMHHPRPDPSAGAVLKASTVAAAPDPSSPPPSMLSELPDDLLRKIALFLDVDSAIHCSMLSKRFVSFLNEKLYQVLCERIYLDQSRMKILNVARYKTWRGMLIHRPRLRLNGLYYLKSSYIKRPVRDMWTEVAPGQILEVVYYRYIRFMTDGRIKYAMATLHPKEVVTLFRDGKHREVELCDGQFTVNNKGEVAAKVFTSHSWVHFRFQLGHGRRGHFCDLTLLEHASLPHADPTGSLIPHTVSSEPFIFKKFDL